MVIDNESLKKNVENKIPYEQKCCWLRWLNTWGTEKGNWCVTNSSYCLLEQQIEDEYSCQKCQNYV